MQWTLHVVRPTFCMVLTSLSTVFKMVNYSFNIFCLMKICLFILCLIKFNFIKVSLINICLTIFSFIILVIIFSVVSKSRFITINCFKFSDSTINNYIFNWTCSFLTKSALHTHVQLNQFRSAVSVSLFSVLYEQIRNNTFGYTHLLCQK